MNKVLIDKAYAFAKQKHRGQLRDGGQSYIIHPIRVAQLILKYKPSKNQDVLIAAALLHDTLEDTYTSYKELCENFGEMVASIVMELTTASFVPKLEGKDVYLSHKMENMTNYALCVKLADRLDNIRDLSDTSQEKRIRILNQTKNIIDYLVLHRNLTDSHKKLIEQINFVLNKYKIIGEE